MSSRQWRRWQLDVAPTALLDAGTVAEMAVLVTAALAGRLAESERDGILPPRNRAEPNPR